MKKEAVSILKKTGKIAGVTCLTLGAIAVVTSTAALKSIKEGAEYLVEKSKAILKETEAAGEVPAAEPEAGEEVHPEAVCGEAPAEEGSVEEVVVEETAAEEAAAEEI